MIPLDPDPAVVKNYNHPEMAGDSPCSYLCKKILFIYLKYVVFTIYVGRENHREERSEATRDQQHSTGKWDSYCRFGPVFADLLYFFLMF